MAYTFAELLGHERAKRLLRRAVQHQRLAHAYLFRGPEGVGKKRAALTLAAWLHCRDPQPDDACGRCPSCRKIAAHTHPDCTLIDPEGTTPIKIDQIRDLQKELAFPPNEARVRVAILVDIGRLGVAAANSLLKTLEEPPPEVLLVLTATEDAPLLDTIVSRCQVVPFAPLAGEEVARICAGILPLEDSELTTLAEAARGSAGRAIALHEHGVADLCGRIRAAVENGAPGEPATVLSLLDLAREAAEQQDRLPMLLDLLVLWLRDHLLAATGTATPRPPAAEPPAAEPPAATGHPGPGHRPPPSWTPATIHRRIERVGRARRQLAANCNPRAVCESLFFALL